MSYKAFNFSVACFLLSGLTFLVADGQVSQTHRYEREIKSSDQSFSIIPIQDEGLALIREMNKYTEGKKHWELLLLDTLLQEKWTKDVPLESQFQLIGYEYTRNFLYLLYRQGELNTNDFFLWQLNLTDHSVETHEIKHQFNFKLSHFSMVGQNALFGGYVSREPAVILYETKEKRVKVIPGFFLTDTELLDLRVNGNATFNALLMERSGREVRKLSVRTFDESGTLLVESEIEIEPTKTILAALTTTLQRDELMVVGTYGDIHGKQSAGFFSVVIDPFRQKPISYFDYGSFENFLNYLTPKRAEKIKLKSRQAHEDKKDPDFRLHVHPVRVEENENGFYLLAEIYVPSSNMSPYPYWNNYYNPYGYGYPYAPYTFNPMRNRYYPSPYDNSIQNSDTRMVESAVVLFDSHGKAIWDHSLKLDEIRFAALEQAGDFVVRGDGVMIASKKEDKIPMAMRYRSGQKMVEDTVTVKLKNEADLLRYESKEDGGIRKWYDHSFYAWGYESLKDRQANADAVRYVFYVNKVEVN